MASITGDENGEAMGCDRFQKGRGGSSEAAPQYRRRTTQRRVTRRSRRPKARGQRLEVEDKKTKLG
jgi:hypothetical protein